MTRSADPGPRRSSRLYGPRSSKEPQLHDPTDARNEGFPASHGRQPVGLSLHVLWVPLPMGAASATLSPVAPPPGHHCLRGLIPMAATLLWVPIAHRRHCFRVPMVQLSLQPIHPHGPSIPTAHSLGATSHGCRCLSMTHGVPMMGEAEDADHPAPGDHTPTSPDAKVPHLPLPKCDPTDPNPFLPPSGPKTQRAQQAAEAARRFVYSKKSLLRRL